MATAELDTVRKRLRDRCVFINELEEFQSDVEKVKTMTGKNAGIVEEMSDEDAAYWDKWTAQWCEQNPELVARAEIEAKETEAAIQKIKAKAERIAAKKKENAAT